MVSKVISTVAVLAVVAVIGVVMMYANTDADVADAAPMHGRKALRMNKLHRVKSHTAGGNGRCPENEGGVQVSGECTYVVVRVRVCFVVHGKKAGREGRLRDLKHLTLIPSPHPL